MKYSVEVYYRFKKARNGVCLGMEIEAADDDDAMEKAKAKCVGSKWPSRIWVATHIRSAPSPGRAEPPGETGT